MPGCAGHSAPGEHNSPSSPVDYGVRVLAASAAQAGTPEDSGDTCDLLGKGSRQSSSQLPGSLFMSALRG